MIIDTADLDPTAAYKLLIGSVLPRAIAWVSTSSTTGVGNIAPISFFTVVGRFPPVLSITLATPLRRHHAQGHFRQHPRHRRIRGQHRHDRAGRRGASLSIGIRHRCRRIRGVGLEKAPSEVISAPRIAGAPISFECVVDRIIPMPPLPDHVVWGRVKRIHVRDDLYLSSGPHRRRRTGRVRQACSRIHVGRQHLHHAAARGTRRGAGHATRRPTRRARRPTTRPSTPPNGHRRALQKGWRDLK